MTAEKYLEQIKKIDAIIINKKRDYERWVEIADGLGGGLSVEDRVQTTRNLHRGQDAIIEYICIEDEIKELENKRKGIIATIERLPYHEYEVLYGEFVDGYMLKELTSRLDKSYSWVQMKKREALKHLQIILDKDMQKNI